MIWAVMVAAIFYILYCGISGQSNTLLFVSLGIMLFEIVVLMLNHWSCPFTFMAKRMKEDWQDGDDIFIPQWLAIHNKTIFGTLLAIGTVLVIIRFFTEIN